MAGVVVLVIFLLKDDNLLDAGYNGYVQSESQDFKFLYKAVLLRENSVGYPVTVDDDKNPEFKKLDFSI